MATNFGHILNNSVGGLFGLPKIVSIEAILRHVQNRLPQFALENRGGVIENENGLTQALVKLLNNRHVLPFSFDKEYMEDETKGSSPRSDFSVITNQSVKFHAHTYTDRQRIFTFEAKRLANLGNAREKEYLVGRHEGDKFINSGGVERFKNSTHGSGLDHVGIIGYLQLHDFLHWEEKLNHWVDDFIRISPAKGERSDPEGVTWHEDDKLLLAFPMTNDFAVFRSSNIRIGMRVSMHHIWVNLIN